MVLDAIQHRYGEGPCLEAAWRHQVMRIDDLSVERRWPRYRSQALRETPIRSILSYEVSPCGDGIAALNFYAERPHAFTEESVEAGEMVAAHVALAWSMMRRHDQFHRALASRDAIGQAKGVVMERFDVDADQAFELLVRLSQQSNTRVVDVARALVNGERPLQSRQR